jgi:hypothetical protein
VSTGALALGVIVSFAFIVMKISIFKRLLIDLTDDFFTLVGWAISETVSRLEKCQPTQPPYIYITFTQNLGLMRM